MTNEEYLLRFHRFQKSRERFFAPKINTALNTQYRQFIQNISSGLSALVIIDPMPVVKVLRNIYMDAGINYAAKVRADLNRKSYLSTIQYKRMPIGFSARMAELIAEYYGQDILNTSIGITDTTKELIKELYNRAYREGLGIDDIVKKLEKTELTPVRARLITRTETNAAANRAAWFVAKESGLNLNKIWLSAMDHRTRRDHIGVNGKTAGIDDYFIVGGEEMLIPGDKGGHDGQKPVSAHNVVNCRCTILYRKVASNN